MKKNESATDKLMRHIWTTYKSRYNAHRRILNADIMQKISLTVISIFILSISVIVINPDILGEERTEFSNIFLIVLSIILLALSLTIGNSQNRLIAFKYHECARKLHRLYNSIVMEIEKNPDFKISDMEDKYNNILDQYELNHEKLDWESIIFQERKENKKNIFQFAIFHIKYFLFTKFLYLALIFVPIVFYLITVFKT